MANSFLLDFLFPKRCISCGKIGSYICRDCFSGIEYIEKPVCPVCQRQAIGALSQRFNQQYLEVLSRTRDTKPQVGLKRKDRLENIKGAFDLRPSRHPEPIRSETHGRRLVSGSEINGKTFVLVDDVYTSGATMQEACKVLKRA